MFKDCERSSCNVLRKTLHGLYFEIKGQTKKLEKIYRQKLNEIEELEEAFLQKAFEGGGVMKMRDKNVY